ncbi:hypothetical protein E2562_012455 [Oryza meyeriana var. granulata]|nr:hypothetical protein E2562_012455 [Oryza meyeriana var. granulata]
MAKSFDCWGKDPFFPAAEEVQESTARMESVYRRWLQEGKVGACVKAAAGGGWGEPPEISAASCTRRSVPPSGR